MISHLEGCTNEGKVTRPTILNKEHRWMAAHSIKMAILAFHAGSLQDTIEYRWTSEVWVGTSVSISQIRIQSSIYFVRLSSQKAVNVCLLTVDKARVFAAVQKWDLSRCFLILRRTDGSRASESTRKKEVAFLSPAKKLWMILVCFFYLSLCFFVLFFFKSLVISLHVLCFRSSMLLRYHL